MNFGQGQAGAGQLSGASNAKEYANQALGQAGTQNPAPDTLLRALSHMESLNKRLGEVSVHVEKIAIAIGGPWPCDKAAPGGTPAATQPPAMALLNSHVDAAHARVTAIEEAIAAIRRSLGA